MYFALVVWSVTVRLLIRVSCKTWWLNFVLCDGKQLMPIMHRTPRVTRNCSTYCNVVLTRVTLSFSLSANFSGNQSSCSGNICRKHQKDHQHETYMLLITSCFGCMLLSHNYEKRATRYMQ